MLHVEGTDEAVEAGLADAAGHKAVDAVVAEDEFGAEVVGLAVFGDVVEGCG